MSALPPRAISAPNEHKERREGQGCSAAQLFRGSSYASGGLRAPHQDWKWLTGDFRGWKGPPEHHLPNWASWGCDQAMASPLNISLTWN